MNRNALYKLYFEPNVLVALGHDSNIFDCACHYSRRKRNEKTTRRKRKTILGNFKSYNQIPGEDVQINIRPILIDRTQIEFELPVFRLKNIGNGPARNITIQWSIQGENINTIALNSDVLRNFDAHIESGLMLTLTQRLYLTTICNVFCSKMLCTAGKSTAA